MDDYIADLIMSDWDRNFFGDGDGNWTGERYSHTKRRYTDEEKKQYAIETINFDNTSWGENRTPIYELEDLHLKNIKSYILRLIKDTGEDIKKYENTILMRVLDYEIKYRTVIEFSEIET